MPLGIFKSLKLYHQYLTQKYGVHASNLAKSDVPGAKSETLESFQNVYLKNTQPPKHPGVHHPAFIRVAEKSTPQFKKIPYHNTKASFSGNTIDPKAEMHEINNIMQEHKKVTHVYRRLVQIWNKSLEV